MHRKCIIGTFKTHQNWKLTRDYLIFSSTLQFWCIFLSEINYHVSSCNFGCIIDIMLCTKIVSAEQIKHVLLNFFKHFSALRMIPPRSVVPGHYRDILEQKSQNLWSSWREPRLSARFNKGVTEKGAQSQFCLAQTLLIACGSFIAIFEPALKSRIFEIAILKISTVLYHVKIWLPNSPEFTPVFLYVVWNEDLNQLWKN